MNNLTLITLIIAAAGLPIFPPLAEAENYSVMATNNIEWGLLNPLRGEASPRAADLWGDRTKDTATGMLVKFNKGFSSPPHIHNVTYRGIVIKGLLHNDDPAAEKMWLPTGSFWTQPAGERHITAANGKDNLIYLEIDSGPYLVLGAEKDFDNGERPINLDQRNLVWLDANDVNWLRKGKTQVALLWGQPNQKHGSFLKLPAGLAVDIESEYGMKVVMVKGRASHQWHEGKTKIALSPSSFFSSEAKGKHKIQTETDTVLYINSNGTFNVK